MTDPRFDDFDAGVQAEEFYSMPEDVDWMDEDLHLHVSEDPYADMTQEELDAELALLDEIDAHADYEWEQAIDDGFLD